MVRLLSKWALNLGGWKVEGEFPEGKKFVVIAAPHTSMWDFVWGRLYYNTIKKSVKFMIKEKYFFFPLGIWIKSLGAIPVKNGRGVGLVKQMVQEFKTRNEFLLTITPEATRKRVKRWKKGFYHIAVEAQVSIVLGFIDYKKKTLGIKASITPSGDEEADLEKIRQIYADVTAKHSEKYNKESI
jgi:1-acyl-sn-glycerol-3-phosphate acyltransferase